MALRVSIFVFSDSQIVLIEMNPFHGVFLYIIVSHVFATLIIFKLHERALSMGRI